MLSLIPFPRPGLACATVEKPIGVSTHQKLASGKFVLIAHQILYLPKNTLFKCIVLGLRLLRQDSFVTVRPNRMLATAAS